MDWQAVLAGRNARMRGSEIQTLLKLLEQPGMLSFAGGIPDPALFPAAAFREAMASALDGANAATSLQYSVSEGHLPLREWIAGHMATLGIACTPAQVFITSGSQQALDHLGKLLLDPGDRALVTWPTYMGALSAFNAYEPRYERLDLRGNQPPSEGRAKFAYLAADFANPTGETLDRAGREALLDLAEAQDIALIEDGAYQALRYDGDPVPPVLALELARKGDLDACRTIYAGSFSKVLSPGLRVGWVVAASAVIRRLVLLKQAGDLHSPTLNQIATHHVARRIYAPHTAMLRGVYGGRRDAMLAALERHMPAGVHWTRPEGGMFVWLTLPEGLDAADLLARALAGEKLAFVPGRAFFADGSRGNALRLSFSCADAAMIDEGMARLGRVIRAG